MELEKIIWLAGPTGCGKSYYIQNWCKENNIEPCDTWYSSDKLQWFDGYIG